MLSPNLHQLCVLLITSLSSTINFEYLLFFLPGNLKRLTHCPSCKHPASPRVLNLSAFSCPMPDSSFNRLTHSAFWGPSDGQPISFLALHADLLSAHEGWFTIRTFGECLTLRVVASYCEPWTTIECTERNQTQVRQNRIWFYCNVYRSTNQMIERMVSMSCTLYLSSYLEGVHWREAHRGCTQLL